MMAQAITVGQEQDRRAASVSTAQAPTAAGSLLGGETPLWLTLLARWAAAEVRTPRASARD